MRHPHPPHHFQTSAIDRSRSCASSSLKTCHLQQSFFHERGRHHYPSIHASSNSISDAAFATQQIADVLYNILQPAFNQGNTTRSDKGVAMGLGLGAGLAAARFAAMPS
ncbi:hypothetical protein BHM03_00014570 [Ensete ventricosum]|nr:hypothetical protein BHM03_00014570 [Ensete ventricosum]